ncbi:MAG TPA: hypothetical protein VE825_04125 [Terriglobales bacterium]|jgi:hypothetical protein|nr:hypothetical protein [Terriglobales bacterium]
MKLSPTVLCLVLLLVSSAALAADCAHGVGDALKPLWEGYVEQIGPSPKQDGACRAVVLAPDGGTLFELTGVNASLSPATGADITNDGKRDVVLETDSGPERCCYVYAIVIPGETPPLQRQFSTSVELNFGDRDGDGKIEIWAHDFAFFGFDHLMREQAPAPLVVFRLRGNTLFNVSQAFWTDYEADINQAKSQIARKDLEDFTGTNYPNAPRGAPGQESSPDDDKKKDLSPEDQRRRNDTKGLVLQVILDYLYGGRGAEGWRYLSEVWPDLDKPRIRQAILKARMSGILAEINRTTPPAPAAQ